MGLYYKGRNKKIIKAVKIANQILDNSKFYEQVSLREKFDNTTLSASEIADRISNYDRTVRVKTWRNPLSSANARTIGPGQISINKAKLKRKNKSIVNTIIHEYVHAVDFGDDGKLEFTHVDNENNGEENNTAPWAIGKISENFA